jgi:hypothetical protein
MDEKDLSDLLNRAAAADPLPHTSVADDIERGRRSRRRRHLAIAGSALATAAVLVSAGAAVELSTQASGTGNGSNAFTPAGGGGSPVHKTRPPRTTPPVSHKTTIPGHMSRIIHDGASTIPQAEWRNALYALAGQRLDPEHLYLNYSTQSLQEGSNEKGRVLGIKLGWQEAGDTGEGMVELALASAGDTDLVSCDDFAPCQPVQVPGYGQVLIGGDPNGQGGYEIIYEQADHEIAQVVVTPLFGNNSLTPTQAPLVSLDRVLALAADPAFNLPSS